MSISREKTIEKCPYYRYTFNGKEAERGIAEGDYDFGARIYDGRLGRWLSCDPLERKYPSLSPYVIVGDMPIIAIDPDGERIVIIYRDQNGKRHRLTYQPGMILDPKLAESSSFLKNTVDALNYLRENGGKEEIDRLVADKRKIKIKMATGKMGTNTSGNTIHWRPHNALRIVDDKGNPTDGAMSAAKVLFHETGHIYYKWFISPFKSFIQKLKDMRSDVFTWSKWGVGKYDTVSDKWILQNYEPKILERGNRTNHYGIGDYQDSPILIPKKRTHQ